MSKISRYSPELRERAVRMVSDNRADYLSEWAAFTAISKLFGRGAPVGLDEFYNLERVSRSSTSRPRPSTFKKVVVGKVISHFDGIAQILLQS